MVDLQDELHTVRKFIYDPCGFSYTEPVLDEESKEYGASKFQVNSSSIVFRIAKTTPKKAGQFVTLWERLNKGPIQAFDALDSFDFVVICARKDSQFGQFVFPKSILLEKGILSKNGKGGKLAFRVYAPWENALNRQAQITQKWQVNYFLMLTLDKETDLIRAQQLYS